MSLLLALQSNDITGSGASTILFSDAGSALEIFEGNGASTVVFGDAGTGLEIFEGSGVSAVIFGDAGTAEEVFLGVGGSILSLSDDGTGTVSGDVSGDGASFIIFSDDGVAHVFELGPPGGGFSFGEHGPNPRRHQPKVAAKPKPKPAIPDIFSYVSGSEVRFLDGGLGDVSLVARGGSMFGFRDGGKGRMMESPAEIIRLLLLADEL